MADASKFKILGETYDIKDSTAREQLEDKENTGNKISAKGQITDTRVNFPSITYLLDNYYEQSSLYTKAETAALFTEAGCCASYDSDGNLLKKVNITSLSPGTFCTDDIDTVFISGQATTSTGVISSSQFSGCTNLKTVIVENTEENLPLASSLPNNARVVYLGADNVIRQNINNIGTVADGSVTFDKLASNLINTDIYSDAIVHTDIAGTTSIPTAKAVYNALLGKEDSSNKVNAKGQITDTQKNYPTITYLNDYYYEQSSLYTKDEIDNLVVTADCVKFTSDASDIDTMTDENVVYVFYSDNTLYSSIGLSPGTKCNLVCFIPSSVKIQYLTVLASGRRLKRVYNNDAWGDWTDITPLTAADTADCVKFKNASSSSIDFGSMTDENVLYVFNVGAELYSSLGISPGKKCNLVCFRDGSVKRQRLIICSNGRCYERVYNNSAWGDWTDIMPLTAAEFGTYKSEVYTKSDIAALSTPEGISANYDAQGNMYKSTVSTALSTPGLYGNENIVTAFIGRHVTSLSGPCFSGCTNLKTVYIDNTEGNVTIGSDSVPSTATIVYLGENNPIRTNIRTIAQNNERIASLEAQIQEILGSTEQI